MDTRMSPDPRLVEVNSLKGHDPALHLENFFPQPCNFPELLACISIIPYTSVLLVVRV
jgi:hypothetical protein